MERLDKLKTVATNDYIFVVNEAVNNKMMHYAGVMTEETLPEATRLIQFPKGEYIVVKGEANTDEELSNKLNWYCLWSSSDGSNGCILCWWSKCSGCDGTARRLSIW